MTSENEYAGLLLQNQLCFPLYAAARKIVAAYHPLLKALDLTYAQYVTLMVLWEEKEISMHQLGKRLYLDSGTLTPVLKKLEAAGYIRPYGPGPGAPGQGQNHSPRHDLQIEPKGNPLFPGGNGPTEKRTLCPDCCPGFLS